MSILIDRRMMGLGEFRLYYPHATLIHKERIVGITLAGVTLDADTLSEHLLISKRPKRYGYKIYIDVKQGASSSIVAANDLIDRDSKNIELKIETNDGVIELDDFVEYFDADEFNYRYYFKKIVFRKWGELDER
jgi:hypothetical protein